MSSSSVKFFMLLNPTPFTSIQRRNSIAYVGKGARKHNHFSESRSLVSFSVKKSVGIRNQISTSEDFDGTLAVEAGSQLKSPWIEWSNLVDYLRSETYLEQVEVQEDILTSLRVPKEFVTVAKSALLFSHKNPDLLWSLSKRDIMIVVDNVSPFMFKNGPQSIRRMKSFLDGSGKDITFQNLDSDKPTTVDLMSFLLSFACNYFYSVEQNSVKNGVLVEESVRSLLNHIIDIKRTVSKNDSSPGSRSFGKSVEMKRGDWICLKCNFMNFAKNMKCLQCNEQRPKRKLTGSEWDCPQCDFYNYGRNVACLRCNCKHPINWSNFESKVETWSSRNTSTDKNSSSISQSLDKILSPTTSFGLSTNTSESNNGSGSLESSSTSRRGFANEHNDSGYVPFVPLSADMFAKSQKKVEPVENTTTSNETGKGLSSSKIENQALDNNEVQSDTSEKWFNKVTETQDKTDLVNPMSDDDFPEIMPIRKGENRFVISKKKDRSLTSPQYKRRLAMEEAHNSNFVPFLPFPPGYFAKKDNQNEKDKEVPASTNPSASEKPAAVSEKQENELVIENSTSYSRGDNETSSLRKDTNVATTSVPQTENQEKVYARKSLEGSLVKEPDPLDMSEEAKAERWFRRVAQIKDISELSQIPDEDFPQIMPMRKGVNRFVVSKRKTPLERRLTSQQYRRNAPIVTSDPEKQSN